MNRSGAECGGITTLLPRSIFFNVFSANAVSSLSTSLYVQLFNTIAMHSLAADSRPRPGTCNLFQVTGQIATLQWSPGPDNIEHVNEG